MPRIISLKCRCKINIFGHSPNIRKHFVIQRVVFELQPSCTNRKMHLNISRLFYKTKGADSHIYIWWVVIQYDQLIFMLLSHIANMLANVLTNEHIWHYNNNNNKDFIYRGFRYIQQRTKSIKIKTIHACMYQPTEHSSSAVGHSYINIKKHTLIYIYLNNIMISR